MISERLASIIIVGGNDAPGLQLVPDGHGGWKLKPIPGWDPELMRELASSLEIMSLGSRLKTAGLSEHVLNSVGGFVEKQLGQHISGGGNVVILNA